MELPTLFQVTEDVIENRFQGLHGEDEFFNILSSVSLRDSSPIGSEVALFVKFKLSSDDLQRSGSEVQMQVIIIVFVTGSLHVLLTAHLDNRSDAVVKVSSSLFPGICGIGAFHTLIRSLRRVVLVTGALSAGDGVNNVTERTLGADDAPL